MICKGLNRKNKVHFYKRTKNVLVRPAFTISWTATRVLPISHTCYAIHTSKAHQKAKDSAFLWKYDCTPWRTQEPHCSLPLSNIHPLSEALQSIWMITLTFCDFFEIDIKVLTVVLSGVANQSLIAIHFDSLWLIHSHNCTHCYSPSKGRTVEEIAVQDSYTRKDQCHWVTLSEPHSAILNLCVHSYLAIILDQNHIDAIFILVLKACTSIIPIIQELVVACSWRVFLGLADDTIRNLILQESDRQSCYSWFRERVEIRAWRLPP